MHNFGTIQEDKYRIVPEDIRERVEILKEGGMFMNSLPEGEITSHNTGGLGFYFSDTRFLSCLEISINGTKPIFLSRTLRDSHFAQVEMTNKEFESFGTVVPLQTIHIRLLRAINDGFYQRIRIINFNQHTVKLNLRIKMGADFADIFEVRGTVRSSKGNPGKPVIRRQNLFLNYTGKDKIRRLTKISFHPAPSVINDEDPFVVIDYFFNLEPKKKYYIYLKIIPLVGDNNVKVTPLGNDLGFTKAARHLAYTYEEWKKECLKISSNNERFDYLVRVAVTDLRALRTNYPGAGTVLEAGIPWYAAPFGRDALIASFQTLLANPSLAEETLRFMARNQGREINPWKDEHPGKIMHEMRFGEMARTGEIPHTPYYGSVDSTIWFIILLAEYVRWTGNEKFLEEMSEPFAGALEWCEKYGDIDGDGYIEYQCQSEKGLVNQGWKDSRDGVISPGGKIPEGPIALVEVQGYYYKALIDAAEIYGLVGEEKKAKNLRAKAESLQKNFLRDFWLDKKGFLAYALDGKKRSIETIVSNPGHCLFTGILPGEQSRRMIKRLMLPDLFSGWGIRTMSNKEIAYNPISYHNGSVWPHDNAIISFGMKKAMEDAPLKKLVEALYEASEHFDHMRLPELFCGFTRRGDAGPVKYPIACKLQAWSSGSIFLMLRALLGIECRGSCIYVQNPQLPRFLQTLRMENIRAGNGTAALEFTRRQDKTYCGIIETKGNVMVVFR